MKKMALALNALISMTVISIAGCSLPNTKQGDGRDWLEVSCSGFADWSKCQQAAANACPNGYDIGSREESVIAQKRVLQFACKK